MTTDFHQKKVYRLIGITAASRLRGHIKGYAKPAYSKAKRREKEQARAAANKAVADAPAATIAPAVPQTTGKPLRLCASKMLTLEKIYLLALGDAGAFVSDARHARTLTRDEVLKKAGMRRKPKRPKPYENVAPQLRLRTAQAGLSVTCHCDVRTLQRHLDDFQTLGLVVVRQQLGLDRYGSPSFQLVLDAAFLDWQEVTLNAFGSPTQEGPDLAPSAAPAAVVAPDLPSDVIAPPIDVFKTLSAVEQFEAMRQKFTAPFAKS